MSDPLQILETILTGMPVFLFSLVFHEWAHAATAARLGHGVDDYQERLTLNPMAHLDPVGSLLFPLIGMVYGGFIFGWAKPVRWSPRSTKHFWRDSMLVSSAGPLANVLLMFGFAFLLRALAGVDLLWASAGDLTPWAKMARFGVYINALLALFNMIPLPPLDGSKVLSYFLRPETAHRLLTFNPMMSMGLVMLLVWQGALTVPLRFLDQFALTLAGLR